MRLLCEEVSILTRPEGRVQPVACGAFARQHRRFNPHPSRRTGATRSGAKSSASNMFQSSPVPKDGCNSSLKMFHLHRSVSILTRPEGRVQLERTDGALYAVVVSILTRPEGRVQPV